MQVVILDSSTVRVVIPNTVVDTLTKIINNNKLPNVISARVITADTTTVDNQDSNTTTIIIIVVVAGCCVGLLAVAAVIIAVVAVAKHQKQSKNAAKEVALTQLDTTTDTCSVVPLCTTE